MVRRHQRIRVLPDDVYSEFFRSPGVDSRQFRDVLVDDIFVAIPDPELRVSLEVHKVALSMVTEDIPQPDGFGGEAALTNGIEVGVFLDDTLLFDFLDGESITTNEGLGQLAGSKESISPATPPGADTNHWNLAFEWDLYEQVGAALLLAPGTQLRITLKDVITADHVLSLTAFATGVYQK